MKNKYQRMTKQEQKAIYEEYIAIDKGKKMISRLKRVTITGIIGIALSIGLIIYALVKEGSIWDYLSVGVLLAFSLYFIIKSNKLKITVLNKEALKEKKS